MVGRDENAILAVLLQRLMERADNVPVDLFQGLDLGGRVAFVRGLVGRLDVNADQVHVLEGLDRVTALGGVVGVEVAGGARALRSAASRSAWPGRGANRPP